MWVCGCVGGGVRVCVCVGVGECGCVRACVCENIECGRKLAACMVHAVDLL